MPDMKRHASMLLCASLALSTPAWGDPPAPKNEATPRAGSPRAAIPPAPRDGSSAAAENIASSTPPTADPFARLQRVVPIEALKPIRSVRLHDRQDSLKRSAKDKIKVLIQTQPKGAVVKWGRRTLGTTPVALIAPKGSTPADLVIRRRGYMVLRTRVQRRISRTYFFKLTPAKFH